MGGELKEREADGTGRVEEGLGVERFRVADKDDAIGTPVSSSHSYWECGMQTWVKLLFIF